MQPVTRRKPAPKTTDVAFREQGPWRGRGDSGKPAGGGEDMKKEGSSPPTALIVAGLLGPWWSARCPPLVSTPAWPLQLFSLFHRSRHFLSLPKAAQFGSLFSQLLASQKPRPGCVCPVESHSRGGVGSGCLPNCHPAKCQENLARATSRTNSSSADPTPPSKVGPAV